MSTYTIPVSGPDPRLAMLRALARKTLRHLGRLWSTAKDSLTRGARLARAGTTTALAALGSATGYQFLRHTTRTVLAGAAHGIRVGLGWLGRGLRAAGRVLRAGIALISPRAADVIEHSARSWIIAPAATVIAKLTSWIGDAAQAVWELSDTTLVRSVTIRAAQAASLILAVHSLTKGAAAAKIVQVLPWAMDAIVTLTNPVRALTLVGAAFLTALAIAALRVLDRPDPGNGTDADHDGPLVDPATPRLLTGPTLTGSPGLRLGEIAAKLNVEVTPDGSVLVHGIPAELPRDLGEHVAQIAAQAATARLERILLHRHTPNRDDKRLLTKVAREAVRRATTHTAA